MAMAISEVVDAVRRADYAIVNEEPPDEAAMRAACRELVRTDARDALDALCALQDAGLLVLAAMWFMEELADRGFGRAASGSWCEGRSR